MTHDEILALRSGDRFKKLDGSVWIYRGRVGQTHVMVELPPTRGMLERRESFLADAVPIPAQPVTMPDPITPKRKRHV